jgi:hypothetical protein
LQIKDHTFVAGPVITKKLLFTVSARRKQIIKMIGDTDPIKQCL